MSEVSAKPGDLVDRYRVLAEVAVGGMATVFVARREHASFDKLLALKLLLPHLRREQRFLDMFVDEARIAAHVHHPNVVQVFDVGEHAGIPYLVMEYLRGHSFAQVLGRTWKKEPRSLPRQVLYGIFAAIAEGLHAAHEAKRADGTALGIVHRDVSPQNVIVGYDGGVKVVDFGIAAARGRISSTKTGEVKGKLAYLAPEQLTRAFEIDRRADLWAFGVMAWEAFGRRSLFRGETESETMWKVVHADVPDIAAEDPELPDSIVDLIERCLERAPFDRPSTAAECAAVLRRESGLSEHELREAVAAHLDAAFGVEKRDEEARIAALLRDGFPEERADSPGEGATGELEEGSPEDTVVAIPSALASSRTQRTAPGSARARLAILGVSVLTLTAAGVYWLGVGRGEERASVHATPASTSAIEATSALPPGLEQGQEPGPEPGRESASRPEPDSGADSEPASDSEPGQTIQLDVGPGVRRVLVDGVLHPERPLSVELGPEGDAELLVVGRHAEVRRHLSADDDGSTVAAPPRRRRVPRRGAEGRERDSASGTGELMHVPL